MGLCETQSHYVPSVRPSTNRVLLHLRILAQVHELVVRLEVGAAREMDLVLSVLLGLHIAQKRSCGALTVLQEPTGVTVRLSVGVKVQGAQHGAFAPLLKMRG